MKSFFEELESYFVENSHEKVLTKWSKYDTEENNVGPKVEEYLSTCQNHFFSSFYPIETDFKISNDDLTPKFTSGFLLHLVY